MKFIMKTSTLLFLCDKRDYGVVCMRGAVEQKKGGRRKSENYADHLGDLRTATIAAFVMSDSRSD
jgi:hypothetical protein